MARPAQVTVIVSALLLAVGAEGCHSPSNPTTLPCQYTVSPAAIVAQADGALWSVTVTTAPTCSWTAVADREWITISNNSGKGSATVTVVVAANPATMGRTGAVALAGRTISVEQAGQPACELALSPDRLTLGPNEATGILTVTTQAYCAWSVSTSAAWIRVTDGRSGQGPGTITYLAERNATTVDRSGELTVNEQVVAVTQEGDLGLCTYSVAPVEFRPCLTPPTLSASLETQDACPWTISPNASWISMESAATGTGTASIRLSVSPNYEAPRQGVVEVRWPTPTAGQNLHVLQAGCLYGVSPSTLTIGPDGGTLRFDVYQQTDPVSCGGPLQDACVWTAVPDVSWLVVVTAMPSKGDGRVTLTVDRNTGASRTATVRVLDRAVFVTQGGTAPFGSSGPGLWAACLLRSCKAGSREP